MSTAAQPLVTPVNRLLSHLPVHQRNAVHRGSEILSFRAGDVLLNAGSHSNHVFFPLEMVVSIVRPLRDDVVIELGVIGNEGMIGLDVVMDAKTQLDDAVVQSAGSALRMPAQELLNLFYGGGPLQRFLLRFTHAFLGQVAQNAACNRFHPLTPRMAKWLLMVHDRGTSSVVHVSPRLIARALGAKEAEIEQTLEALTAAGALRRQRDAITIQRERLELMACECYETLRESYARSLAS